MIALDTGPIIALFDPKDRDHEACRRRLQALDEAMFTTLPVLTEAFHILAPESRGADRLKDFLSAGGVEIFFGDVKTVARMLELMDKYSDHPMDLADASIIAGAEALETRKVFTLDNRDFETYRIKRGHRYYAVEIV